MNKPFLEPNEPFTAQTAEMLWQWQLERMNVLADKLEASEPVFDHYVQGLNWQDHQCICLLIGHDANWDLGYTPCRRCAEPLTYEQIGWPGAWQWLRQRWETLRQWRKCHFCGGRFGRHSSECEDVPF